MRVLTIAGMLLLTPCLLAQGDAQEPVTNLELRRLLPREMVNGVPQAFTFKLASTIFKNALAQFTSKPHEKGLPLVPANEVIGRFRPELWRHG